MADFKFHLNALRCWKCFYILTFLKLTEAEWRNICVGNLIIFGSDNGLAPTRRQCWDIVKLTIRNKLRWNLNRNLNIFFDENAFENIICEMLSISSRPDNGWSAPGHYLNQCWNIVKWTHRNKFRWNLHWNIKYFFWRICVWKCHLRNAVHLISASLC